MRLLFDENLSPKLPQLLATLFPDSRHLRECGLKGATDEIVWEYAQSHNFAVVSKDSDFYHRSLLYGQPPKLIWLRVGNCTRTELVRLLTEHQQDIEGFFSDQAESILVLS